MHLPTRVLTGADLQTIRLVSTYLPVYFITNNIRLNRSVINKVVRKMKYSIARLNFAPLFIKPFKRETLRSKRFFKRAEKPGNSLLFRNSPPVRRGKAQ